LLPRSLYVPGKNCSRFIYLLVVVGKLLLNVLSIVSGFFERVAVAIILLLSLIYVLLPISLVVNRNSIGFRNERSLESSVSVGSYVLLTLSAVIYTRLT
jgi:hypothetical protein